MCSAEQSGEWYHWWEKSYMNNPVGLKNTNFDIIGAVRMKKGAGIWSIENK